MSVRFLTNLPGFFSFLTRFFLEAEIFKISSTVKNYCNFKELRSFVVYIQVHKEPNRGLLRPNLTSEGLS